MPKTLLLGLDGLDWQILRPLIDRGELPAFAHLLEAGVTGNLNTLEPTLSPMLWNSIATGKRGAKHGIHGFTEVDPKTGRVRPTSSLTRKCKAVWNILQQNGATCHLLNWFASHPAELLKGSSVSDLFPEGAPPLSKPWPLRPGIIHPERLGPTLAGLRMGPDELDGEILRLFVPRGGEVDQSKDKRLYVLARELSKAFSVHNAATWLLQNEPWDFTAVYWRTTDLLFHYFMPFHPPAIAGVEAGAAELYKDVVSSVCRMFDGMLGTYLRIAGPEATVIVISDHGFQSGKLRPAFAENPFENPEAWHRPQGIFLARGPKLKSGSTIHGARLLDIAPTILTLHGLAGARDMDGRVLVEAFKEEPALEYIDTWETVPGDTGQHPPGTEFDSGDAEQLIQQFVDLGYIEPLDKDFEKAATQTRLANDWNLVRDLLDSGQAGPALPILEKLHHLNPTNPVFAQALAATQRHVGMVDEANTTLGALLERLKPGPALMTLRAEIALEKKDYAEGLRLLTELEREDPRQSGLHLRLARTYLGLGRFKDSQREFETVLDGDPENASACQGLAHVLLRRRHWDLAAGSALKAVGLQHNLPMAHHYLGLALVRLGHRAVALDAFRAAIAYAPGLVPARRALIRLLEEDAAHAPETPTDVKLRKVIHSEQSATGKALAPADELDQQRIALRAIAAHRARSAARVREIRARAKERAAARAALQKNEPPTCAADISKPAGEASARDAAASGAKLSPSGEFLIVSGLPRSGTSLMMQILDAGGVPLMTDGIRRADTDNTEGYFEWEAIRGLPKNPNLLDEARGRGFKVISLLLSALPRRHRYKVLFMQRPEAEVAASQHKMLQRRFPAKTHASPDKMAESLAVHRKEVLSLMRGIPGISLLEVSYPDLVREPAAWLPRIRDFLAPEWVLDIDKAVSVIKPGLHRQRLECLPPHV